MRKGDAKVLQVAQLVPCTEAEGPGRRFALWFQGCPLRCPGCCNPEMLSFTGGQQLTVHDVAAQLERAVAEQAIEGITLLGGEPFAHAAGATALARAAHRLDLTVMVFTGYTVVELEARPELEIRELLQHTDILVDGPYRQDMPERRRRRIGSANQQVHFLSGRCRPDDPRWLLPNTLEIRLRGQELSVNGFPVRSVVGNWSKTVQPVSVSYTKD